MQIWDDLMRSALVGTRNQALELPEPEGAVESLLARLEATDREGSLLAAAGVLALARRAGAVPQTAGTEVLPSLAEADDVRVTSSLAVHDLALMLAGEFEEALPEWLSLAAEHRQRVPEDFLPQLLDLGRRKTELRSGIGAVLGKRGRWLAARNPEWDFALQKSLLDVETADAADLQQSVKQLWEEGTRGERTSAVATVRAKYPAEARAMLEAVWSSEPYEERAAFIRTLETNLSMEDEPFLEASLDDKRKEVRTVAQELLQRLPESRFGKRISERLAVLVFWNQKGHIELHLPEAYDKAWARDGIDQKPPQYPKIGEKTFWAQQMIPLAPLAFWQAHLGKSPTYISRANLDKDWRDILRAGWVQAIQTQHDPAWAEAMMDLWIRGDYIPHSIPWSQIFSKERLEEFASRMLQESTAELNYNHPLLALLPACGPIISSGLAHAVLDKFRATEKKANNYYWGYTLQSLLPLFPDDRQDDLLDLWSSGVGNDNYYRQQFDHQAALRQFRKEMRGKFA